MIGLFKVKEKQREQAQNASRGGGASVKKQSAGELRLHKGINIYIPFHCFKLVLSILSLLNVSEFFFNT